MVTVKELTETEGSLVTANTVISLRDIIPIDQILTNTEYKTTCGIRRADTHIGGKPSSLWRPQNVVKSAQEPVVTL